MGLDLSYFDMTFKNMVVSVLGAGGTPELTNAGEQRFKGFETALELAPDAAPGTTVSLGYAHHDAKFVHFTFVTPDGTFRDVSGKRLELVPEDLVTARVNHASPVGIGVFGAVRYQSERPLNRRNTFFTDAHSEYDAGASYRHQGWMASVTGRNLGDDRHLTSESDIGDSQFYVAPPRRVSAQVSHSF